MAKKKQPPSDRYEETNRNSVRSETLVHWTQPLAIKLAKKKGELSDNYELTPDFRNAYLALLKLIYQNGLRYSPNIERAIRGTDNTATCLPNGNIICYTELHMHQVKSHTDRYGKMGIGFSRHHLLHPYGANPVFYVPNIGQGIISHNLEEIVENRNLIPKLEKGFIAFIKPMSEYFEHSEGPRELEYYEEMEWRMIPPGILKLKDGSIKSEFEWCELHSDGYWYFRFPCSLVTTLILPDEESIDLVKADKEMKGYLAQSNPHIQTLEQAMHPKDYKAARKKNKPASPKRDD